MIELTAQDGAPLLVNPAHIWHVRPAAGGQAAIHSASGAVLFVAESFTEVAALLRAAVPRG